MIRVCLLAMAVCADGFFAAMGCSMGGIAIPKRCALLISAVGTAFLSVSLLFAEFLEGILPETAFRYGGCAVLGIMGISQICKGMLRHVFAKREYMQLHCRGLGLMVQICLDETYADADGSKSLSLGEALPFAAAFSVDSLVSGLGAGISCGDIPACLLVTLVLGFIMTMLGSRIGRICRAEHDFSWLGGILLVLLAVSRAV